MKIPAHDDRAAWLAILAELKKASGADDVALVFAHGDTMLSYSTDDGDDANELDFAGMESSTCPV